MDARTSRAIDNKTDPPRVLLSTSFTGTVPEGTVLSTSFTGTVPEGTVLSTSFTISEDAQSHRSSNASGETDSSSFISEDAQSRKSSSSRNTVMLSFLESALINFSRAGSGKNPEIPKTLLDSWDDQTHTFNFSDIRTAASKSSDPHYLQKCLKLVLNMVKLNLLQKPGLQYVIEDSSIRDAVQHSWNSTASGWSLTTLATTSTTSQLPTLIEDTVNKIKELLETHDPTANIATSFLLPTSKAGERVKAKDFGEIDDFIIQHKNKATTYVPMDQRSDSHFPWKDYDVKGGPFFSGEYPYSTVPTPPPPHTYEAIPKENNDLQPSPNTQDTQSLESTSERRTSRSILQRAIRRIMRR